MRFLTWNILAQSTIPDELQLTLSWERRLPAILNYLKQSRADLICLQEVELNTFEADFKELLSSYQFARHVVCMKGKNKRTNAFGNVTLWKVGQMIATSHGSRSLHVTLRFAELEQDVCISNVHFPARPGFEGYLEKRKHLRSCAQKWPSLNVILVGDYNDNLSHKTEDGFPAGLHMDLTCLGFVIPENELKKQTCHTFHGNIYNLDHIISRANIHATYISQAYDVTTLPSETFPSDHLPVLYDVFFVLSPTTTIVEPLK